MRHMQDLTNVFIMGIIFLFSGIILFVCSTIISGLIGIYTNLKIEIPTGLIVVCICSYAFGITLSLVGVLVTILAIRT